jgi:hypothetical protein
VVRVPAPAGLELETGLLKEIFGSPDDVTFQSSMTLFAVAAADLSSASANNQNRASADSRGDGNLSSFMPPAGCAATISRGASYPAVTTLTSQPIACGSRIPAASAHAIGVPVAARGFLP